MGKKQLRTLRDSDLRKEDFKIGEIHGKTKEVGVKEARMRNSLYLIGRIIFGTTEVKLIAYEMPLGEKQHRDLCIDLLGIDKDWNFYVIELKCDDSKDKLEDAIKQVEKYKEYFVQILAKENIKNEIEKSFFYKNFKPGQNTFSLVLAPKKYFENNKKPNITSVTKCFIFSSRWEKKIFSIMEKFNKGNLRPLRDTKKIKSEEYSYQ